MMMEFDQETLIDIDDWLQDELCRMDFRSLFVADDLLTEFDDLDPETRRSLTAIVEQRLTEWMWKREGQRWRRLEGQRKAQTIKLADGRRTRIRSTWPKVDRQVTRYPRLEDAFRKSMERTTDPQKSKVEPGPKWPQSLTKREQALLDAQKRLGARQDADRKMLRDAGLFRAELAELQSGLWAF